MCAPADPVAPFQLGNVLGTGGSAVVYHVLDAGGSPFAFKVPREGTPRGLFLQEASRAVGLVHSNIVRVYGTDTAGGMTGLVCEYADGGTLERRLGPRQGERAYPFRDLGEFWRLADDLAAGLDHVRG